jgi:hypothetical protein
VFWNGQLGSGSHQFLVGMNDRERRFAWTTTARQRSSQHLDCIRARAIPAVILTPAYRRGVPCVLRFTVTPALPLLWDAFEDLNGMLRRYTSTPMFFPLKSTASGWEVSDVRVPDRPAQESHAVRAVIELAKQNKLQRLRSCDCGRWYFVKFSHQRFCSAECRIKFWESSEERKVQKRERARDNYVYKKIHQGK